MDDKSISNYAVNGAMHYARCMIASGKYKEVLAIGVAGDSSENTEIIINYVFGYTDEAYKPLPTYKNFNFLENQSTFEAFYQEIQLTETEKHQILIDSRAKLQEYAKKLNKLMHNHNITAGQRVLYVSGMLLAMQDVVDVNGSFINAGLAIEDLKGVQSENYRDGKLIVNKIGEFLEARGIELEKRKLMLASFSEISKDTQRDKPFDNDKEIAKFLPEKSSTNKQIFSFIYNTIFLSIDSFKGHLDIM